MTQPLSVAIAYNRPVLGSDDLDHISEADVLGEVEDVDRSLIDMGYRVYRVPLGGDVSRFISHLKRVKPDVVFNLCEGYSGESLKELNVAALFELLGLPYTGSPPLALGLALDKAKTKALLKSCGIPTPDYRVSLPGKVGELARMEFPLIVKPVHEDASLGIHPEAVVWDPTQLERQINYIADRYDQQALVESFIEGRELNVSLVGDGELRVLPISEIDFSDLPPDVPRICSYRAKWVLDSPEYQGTEPVCPAQLAPEVEERVKGIALGAFSLVGCRDYGRVDIRLDKADVPYVLEVNPNPAISMNEGLARSVAISGINYGDFMAEIVGYAYRRKTAFKNKEANRPG